MKIQIFKLANYLKSVMHGNHIGLSFMLITICAFFLVGFLPSLISLKAYSDKRHIDGNNIVHISKNHQKLVLIVVDALRRDFVLETNKIHVKKDWPFLRSLFTERKACIFQGIADSPTVTMPRVKAMVSGTVPNFVDILNNLQSEEYFDDNLIDIAIQHKKAVIFYGDDTWVKMFPGAFLRYEGTTSFFASDYTEVDVNVTRHIDRELASTDWDIMILHYLGLDHIGHIHGPASFLVPEKLLEMDAVLEKIYRGLKSRNEPFTILMTGDHGMSPGGSHGGSSPEETQVPLVFVNEGCIQRLPSSIRDLGTFRQIDITPTLAALLDVPIPQKSLGVYIPNILFSEQIFSVEHQATLMLENLKHLYNISATRGVSSYSFEEKFDHLRTELTESSLSIESKREWLRKSFIFAKEIQSELGKGSNIYDLWTMVISAFLMFLVFFCSCVMVFGDSCGSSVKKLWHNLPLILILTGLGCISYVMISPYFSNEIFAFPSLVICLFQSGVTTYVFSLLHHLLPKTNFKTVFFSVPQVFTLFGIFYHGLSLFSSSFVEEEHQTWYYVVPTLLLLISLKNIETSFTKIESNERMKAIQNRDFLSIMGAVCIHRIAKHWNQTGDKWAREVDIEDWLIGEDNYVGLMIFFFIGLVGICCLIVWEEQRNFKRIIFSFGIIAVLLYRYLEFLEDHTSHWLVFLPRFVYALVFLLFLMTIYGRTSTPLPSLVLLLVLLRRPHNVPLLLLQLIQAKLVQRPLAVLLQYEKGLFFLYTAYSWLGIMWFFYQGNSNSLSRIDVAAGYIGVGSYQPFLVGILLLISTFQGPLLAFLFYLKNLEINNIKENEWSSRFYYLCLLRSFPLCIHFVTIIILRNHIFIWSVFAPKLVYEVTLTLFIFFITFISVLKRGIMYFF